MEGPSPALFAKHFPDFAKYSSASARLADLLSRDRDQDRSFGGAGKGKGKGNGIIPSTSSLSPRFPTFDPAFSSGGIPLGMGRRRSSSTDLDDESDPILSWNEPYGENASGIGATIGNDGVISLNLHDGMKVDITFDKGIRVINNQSKIILALSPDGNSCALIHPTGLVYGYGSRVEITTCDTNGNTKFAKMSYKGVSFTSDSSALVYLVDSAGTRTTTDTFSDLSGDFTVPVFLHNAHYGPHMINECSKILRLAQYWMTEEGIENWVVNGIRVSQTLDGLVRIGRGTSKYQLRTSPTTGTASITTPQLHTTASVGIAPSKNSAGNGPHLFVKRGERRLHSDGVTFIVRNAGHASGFDEFNQLKVY